MVYELVYVLLYYFIVLSLLYCYKQNKEGKPICNIDINRTYEYNEVDLANYHMY